MHRSMSMDIIKTNEPVIAYVVTYNLYVYVDDL